MVTLCATMQVGTWGAGAQGPGTGSHSRARQPPVLHLSGSEPSFPSPSSVRLCGVPPSRQPAAVPLSPASPALLSFAESAPR